MIIKKYDMAMAADLEIKFLESKSTKPKIQIA